MKYWHLLLHNIIQQKLIQHVLFLKSEKIDFTASIFKESRYVITSTTTGGGGTEASVIIFLLHQKT